jgi:hypothetical protein
MFRRTLGWIAKMALRFNGKLKAAAAPGIPAVSPAIVALSLLERGDGNPRERFRQARSARFTPGPALTTWAGSSAFNGSG